MPNRTHRKTPPKRTRRPVEKGESRPAASGLHGGMEHQLKLLDAQRPRQITESRITRPRGIGLTGPSHRRAGTVGALPPGGTSQTIPDRVGLLDAPITPGHSHAEVSLAPRICLWPLPCILIGQPRRHSTNAKHSGESHRQVRLPAMSEYSGCRSPTPDTIGGRPLLSSGVTRLFHGGNSYTADLR